MDGTKAVLLEKEETQRGIKGTKNSVTSKNSHQSNMFTKEPEITLVKTSAKVSINSSIISIIILITLFIQKEENTPSLQT